MIKLEILFFCSTRFTRPRSHVHRRTLYVCRICHNYICLSNLYLQYIQNLYLMSSNITRTCTTSIFWAYKKLNKVADQYHYSSDNSQLCLTKVTIDCLNMVSSCKSSQAWSKIIIKNRSWWLLSSISVSALVFTYCCSLLIVTFFFFELIPNCILYCRADRTKLVQCSRIYVAFSDSGPLSDGRSDASVKTYVYSTCCHTGITHGDHLQVTESCCQEVSPENVLLMIYTCRMISQFVCVPQI